jgi:hypothetical protein
MQVRVGTTGSVTNTDRRGHCVRVEDDRANTGGFLVYEWWEGSNGPNENAAFDSWVESQVELSRFFQEAGWLVQWHES